MKINLISIATVATVCVAGLVLNTPCSADLMIRNIDVVLENEELALDLDLDGTFDFRFSDSNTSGFASSVSSPALILSDPLDIYSPAIFSRGDSVGSDSFEYPSSTALLYGSPGDPFEEIGTTGYLGLVLQNNDTGETNFGWAEITRGSLIIGQVGFETTPNTPALIPVAVPEPCSFLIFAGMAICGCQCRRQRQSCASAN